MVGTYVLKHGDRQVGTVHVERQGLYYHFSCRCRLTGQIMHHLVVFNGANRVDLGVCVPMDGVFGVEKKISCKQFGGGAPEFQLLPKHERMQGKFVPIYPEEPFAYMSRLQDAFLVNQAGQPGIVIYEKRG